MGLDLSGQDGFPVFAPIDGSVDAALRIVDVDVFPPLRIPLKGGAKHGRIGDIGILRMYDDVPYLADLLPDVRPRFAAVGRNVDAIAGGDVAADVGFPGAHIDDVGIGRSDRNGAYARRGLIVED